MKTVFVCSPLRGDVEKNIGIARELCRAAIMAEGVAPFAPHVFYTQFLDDSKPEERNFGMLAGIRFLRKCDEIWVFDVNGVFTEGMLKEIAEADRAGIPIVFMPDCWKPIAERVMNG